MGTTCSYHVSVEETGLSRAASPEIRTHNVPNHVVCVDMLVCKHEYTIHRNSGGDNKNSVIRLYLTGRIFILYFTQVCKFVHGGVLGMFWKEFGEVTAFLII